MKQYGCPKCGSVDVFLDDRGSQVALMCGDCGKWIKWVGKSEIPLVKRWIESNSNNIQTNKVADERVDIIFDILNEELSIGKIFNNETIKQAIAKALEVINE